MSFLNPLGLIGLLALPVIVGLHLLRKRQRQTLVSHLGLWTFLDAQARGPRARRIPLSWLLLLDLLVGALLSLALAQPRLDISLPVFNARQVVILMDVSSSMLARSVTSSRIDQARSEALTLLDRLGPRDTVTVVAFGRTARLVGDSRQDSFDQLSARIESLQAGETGAALSQAFALGEAALEKTLPVEFHVFSDGNFPVEDPNQLAVTSHPVRWHFFDLPADNQAVLALTATLLDEDHFQIFARLANFGSGNVSRRVSLAVDGQPVSSDQVEIPAGTSVTKVWQATVSIPPRSSSAVTVSLSGRDALSEDDTAAIGLQASGSVRVGLVAENPAPLQQAILAVPDADLQLVNPEEYNQLAAQSAGGQPPFDLTIFRGFIPSTWPGGQVLVVEPPTTQGNTENTLPGSGGLSLASASSQDIPAGAPLRFPYADPLLSGMDFGGVRWSQAWSLANPPDGFVTLLQAGETPLLLRGLIDDPETGLTRVFVLLADLSRGNFTKHPAFPILIANLIQNLSQPPLPPGVQSGEAIPLPNPGGFQTVQVFTPEGPAERFSATENTWPASWVETLDPGLYRFRLESEAGEVVEYLSGVNAGSDLESDLRPREWSSRVGTGSANQDSGPGGSGDRQGLDERQIDLTPWLLGMAVLALFLEAALAWKPVVNQP